MPDGSVAALDALRAYAPPAAGPVVRQVDPVVEDERWDADLAACPAATFFHGSAWAQVLESAYGLRPAYLTVRASGRLVSLLALMEADSWLTGRRGVSLPFTDECAPLCPDAESAQRLLGQALDHARARRWRYLEIRGGRSLFAGAPCSARFLGHRLDLRGGEAALLARFDPSVRRAIRKAVQGGLEIEFSQAPDAVRAFHRLMCQTRRRHGVPPQPLAFFGAIQKHVLARNRGWVVLARHGTVPVAGAVYFRFGRTVIYKYGASDEAYQHLRANNLVMWEAIRRHAHEGFETLDFGRTAPENDGLRRFKLGWGAIERPIEYVRCDARTGAFLPDPGPSHAWTHRLFRILPTPFLRLIGSTLYRHAA